MVTDEIIGSLMRKHRKEKHMSLQQVADQMGKARNSISLLELGRTGIEITTLEKYCSIIGYDYLDLMREADEIASKQRNR